MFFPLHFLFSMFGANGMWREYQPQNIIYHQFRSAKRDGYRLPNHFTIDWCDCQLIKFDLSIHLDFFSNLQNYTYKVREYKEYRNSQFHGIFSKQMVLKVLLRLYFIVKNTKLWSFSIKFGELRCKNVSNTFIIKREFA